MPESNDPTISKYIKQLTPADRQGRLQKLNELQEEQLINQKLYPRRYLSTIEDIAYITDILNRNGYEID